VLVENMSDGVVVLDTQNRIVDANPAARRVLHRPGHPLLGEPVDLVFDRWGDLIQEVQAAQEVHMEITTTTPDAQARLTYLDLQVSMLQDENGWWAGKLIVWRDITALKQAQADLRRMANTDGLTEIYNRRYFLELARLELERSIRYHHDLSILLMDLDHFKTFNDRYGHLTGDQVLLFFARVCQEQLRLNDIFARFGGEEFILLLPETGLQAACQVAERLRLAVQNTPFQAPGRCETVHVSLGVAVLQDGSDTLEKMIQRADQALYRAKEAGRNRVESGSL
jgi:diguanylate cyclase (GGDEF)-like protein/PAS domain S-box-containing protein